MKNKVILISIIILGILLGGFFLFSQNNTQTGEQKIIEKTETSSPNVSEKIDTSDWETCRNKEYGYEFKYPRKWYMYNSKESYSKESPIIVRKGENCVGEIILSNLSLPSNIKNLESAITFSVSKRNQEQLSKTIYSRSKSVNDFFNKAGQKFRDIHPIIKESILDTEKVLWTQDSQNLILWFFHKDSLFKIITNIENPKTLDTIISTFKFIN